MAQHDNIDASKIAGWGLIASVALAVTVLLLQVLFLWQDEAVRANQPGPQRLEQRQSAVEDAERLGGYAWVERDKDIVRVPIERAMELVVAERRTTSKETGGN